MKRFLRSIRCYAPIDIGTDRNQKSHIYLLKEKFVENKIDIHKVLHFGVQRKLKSSNPMSSISIPSHEALQLNNVKFSRIR